MAENDLKGAFQKLVELANVLDGQKTESEKTDESQFEKHKDMFATIMESMKPVPRVCRMCGCDYVGYKVICDSKSCWDAWQYEMERIRTKYVCGQLPTGLVFYQDCRSEIEKDKDNK